MKLIAFAVIMIGVFIVLGIVGKFLEGILNLVLLGWLNKLLGVAFSLLKTALIVGLLIMLFSSINNNLHIVSEEVLAQSLGAQVSWDEAAQTVTIIK